jgi:hypothetical protein
MSAFLVMTHIIYHSFNHKYRQTELHQPNLQACKLTVKKLFSVINAVGICLAPWTIAKTGYL